MTVYEFNVFFSLRSTPVSVLLSVYLFIYLSNYLSIYLSIDLSISQVGSADVFRRVSSHLQWIQNKLIITERISVWSFAKTLDNLGFRTKKSNFFLGFVSTIMKILGESGKSCKKNQYSKHWASTKYVLGKRGSHKEDLQTSSSVGKKVSYLEFILNISYSFAKCFKL